MIRIALILLSIGLCPAALAKKFDTYRIDYSKNVFCSAVGGACASDIIRENSFFQNPAQLTLSEGWFFDGDYVFDENKEQGVPAEADFIEQIFMAGVGTSFENLGPRIGLGFSLFGYHEKLSSTALFIDANASSVYAPTTVESLSLYYNFPISVKVNEKTFLGISILGYEFFENVSVKGSKGILQQNHAPILSRVTPTLGILYKVKPWLNIGSWYRGSKVVNFERKIHAKDTLDREVVVTENNELVFPWQWSTGVSIEPFADESRVLFDLVMVGISKQAALRTKNEFIDHAHLKYNLRKKGENISFEPHFGFRKQVFQGGRWFLHFGSYLEAARVENTKSRWHFNIGSSYRLREKRDLEPLLSFDLARDYLQIYVTVRI